MTAAITLAFNSAVLWGLMISFYRVLIQAFARTCRSCLQTSYSSNQSARREPPHRTLLLSYDKEKLLEGSSQKTHGRSRKVQYLIGVSTYWHVCSYWGNSRNLILDNRENFIFPSFSNEQIVNQCFHLQKERKISKWLNTYHVVDTKGIHYVFIRAG